LILSIPNSWIAIPLDEIGFLFSFKSATGYKHTLPALLEAPNRVYEGLMLNDVIGEVALSEDLNSLTTD
jgi:hypothetical protein